MSSDKFASHLKAIMYRLSAPIHLEILQNLLLSPSCPRPVLCLCGPKVLTLFNEKNGKGKISVPGIDISSIRRVIAEALELRNKGDYTCHINDFPAV